MMISLFIEQPDPSAALRILACKFFGRRIAVFGIFFDMLAILAEGWLRFPFDFPGQNPI
ncbi:MAG: hypothetical protein M3H12_14975 [Chromatiales bacterium]